MGGIRTKNLTIERDSNHHREAYTQRKLLAQNPKWQTRILWENRWESDPRSKSGDWTQLRFLADGTAFGAGTYTPNQPKKPYRLLVGILNTDLPESRVVPPEEVATYNRVTRYKNP